MKVETFGIPGVLCLTPKVFEDNRGFFSETYNERTFADLGIASRFVQDNFSLSKERGTVRGLHFQASPHAQEKLVRVVRGAIFDIALDVRIGSPTFGEHVGLNISAENRFQLFIPVGFAHGFCTLEPNTEVIYKVTDYWYPNTEGGVLWNDSTLRIPWPPFAGAQVTPKDAALPPLNRLEAPFRIDSPDASK